MLVFPLLPPLHVYTHSTACESLLDDFDPLRQTTTNIEAPQTNVQVKAPLATLEITTSSPTLNRSSNPFRLSTEIGNPFQDQTLSAQASPQTKDIRHCISETNLTRLKLESTSRSSELHVSRSQDNLMDLGSEVRHCIVPEENEDPLDYKNRRVTRSIDNSPTLERRSNGRESNKTQLEFNGPSTSKAMPSQASMEVPETTGSVRKRRR